MSNTNPVFIVDDDRDDQEFVKDIWKELGYENPLLFYENGEAVLKELKTCKIPPFLILCDVNIPKMNGFELKEKILEDDSITYKSIPFVFWSTQVSNEQVKKAYDLAVNGFFIKENTMEELKASLAAIMNYWQRSKQPEV